MEAYPRARGGERAGVAGGPAGGGRMLEAAPSSEAAAALRSLAEEIQARRQGQIRKALTVL